MGVSIRYVDSELYFREGDAARLESKASEIAGAELEIVTVGKTARSGAMMRCQVYDRLAGEAWPNGDYPCTVTWDMAEVVGLFEQGSHIDVFDEDDGVFLRYEADEANGSKTILERSFCPFLEEIPWSGGTEIPIGRDER